MFALKHIIIGLNILKFSVPTSILKSSSSRPKSEKTLKKFKSYLIIALLFVSKFQHLGIVRVRPILVPDDDQKSECCETTHQTLSKSKNLDNFFANFVILSKNKFIFIYDFKKIQNSKFCEKSICHSLSSEGPKHVLHIKR
ncbi:hypothetical protein BpHYR1_015905 [Brachionus plicatilis]|uniref:Uncharacterized protein n=1 Tax=Brachionus plicatilis TaxID=10195 RepID=A0A3M7RT86_BRAPC|nr:hypothetical protein BpHYR1_015905 [Brachionus plicatilis]